MYTRKMILIHIFVFLFLYQINIVITQTPCSIERREGRCIAYGQCETLNKLVFRYGLNLPTHEVNYVQKSFQQCDFVDKKNQFCCVLEDINEPSSLNPNGVKMLSGIDCGHIDNNRISFGQYANLREFPWMALIRYDSPDSKYLCSGSVITNRYVLTAAHCIVGNRNKVVGVRLGEYNMSSVIDCSPRGKCSPPVEDYGVDKIIIHENYINPISGNDIALIKLDRIVNFQDHIQPICLPLPDNAGLLDKNEFLIVAGWGLTEKGTTSEVLMKTSMYSREKSACERIFRRLQLSHSHLCAGSDDFSDSCEGDSGSPLFQLNTFNKRKRYIQYGIVSFGTKCGDKSWRLC